MSREPEVEVVGGDPVGPGRARPAQGRRVTPWLDDGDVRLYHGDALTVLRELPDGSVDCCVTSPPYWGLRDYGTGEWEGGDPGCGHEPRRWEGPKQTQGAQSGHASKQDRLARTECKCGARRVDRQMGLEATQDEFVAGMVAVFREIRRVLAPHGTCWVNLGDSYAGSWGAQSRELSGGDDQGANGPSRNPSLSTNQIAAAPRKQSRTGAIPEGSGLKPKDLVGIPWRVAFALQADGWYLRSDIVWAKPNPMPESVTDRPTKSHEYVFLLTKRPRYFFDQEAVREAYEGDPEYRYGRVGAYQNLAMNGEGDGTTPTRIVGPDGRRKTTVKGADGSIQHRDGERWPNAGRNVRSVWTIATQPYPEAHFATYPEELARRCILAGCPVRVCRVCGKPSERIVDTSYEKSPVHGAGSVVGRHYTTGANNFDGAGMPRLNKVTETVGWSDCGHNAYRPDDHEVIASPTGERAGDDPSMTTGRAGMNRPRHPNEGRRPMTRYQQRMYAEQLKASEHRKAMTDEAGGTTTFAHYIRTDRSGARPVPASLLETWIGRGWLERVEPAEAQPHNNWRPGVVLDPFIGSGTTAKVARDHQRHAIGIDLNEQYLQLAARRLQQLSLLNEAQT